MDYLKEIKEYIPKDEEEEKTKEKILAYIETFGNEILQRENYVAHFTSSAWVMNKTRDKVLMVYHKIYDSWMWTGGHSDGDSDLLGVALRETKEETGVTSVVPISSKIYMIDIFPVLEHIRKGKRVPPHLHLNVAYLLEADENEITTIQADENTKVGWIPISDIAKYATKEAMQKMGLKLIEQMKREKGIRSI